MKTACLREVKRKIEKSRQKSTAARGGNLYVLEVRYELPKPPVPFVLPCLLFFFLVSITALLFVGSLRQRWGVQCRLTRAGFLGRSLREQLSVPTLELCLTKAMCFLTLVFIQRSGQAVFDSSLPMACEIRKRPGWTIGHLVLFTDQGFFDACIDVSSAFTASCQTGLCVR